MFLLIPSMPRPNSASRHLPVIINASIDHLIPLPCRRPVHRSTNLPVHLFDPTSQWIMDGKEGSFESYTLLQLVEKMREVRELGKWKDYMVVRDSEATFTEGFERQEAIIRYLGAIDPAGENIDINQKKEAAKQCNCTLENVESAFSNFTLAKETQRKIKQLKAEGKPLPKSMDEVEKLMGSSPMEDVRSKLLKSGVIISNAICPCGSQKLYKRCCGKDRSS